MLLCLERAMLIQQTTVDTRHDRSRIVETQIHATLTDTSFGAHEDAKWSSVYPSMHTIP